MNRNDKLLIAGMLAATLVFFVLFRAWQKESGSTVLITVDGNPVAELPLANNTEYTVRGLLGESVVAVKNGAVFMQTAPCPDQICVKHKEIHYGREQIVCLPGRIVVEIRAGQAGQAGVQETPDIDGVVN